MPTRCVTCHHQRSADIDRDLIAGRSAEAVAKRYGLNPGSVRRHVRNHIPEHARAKPEEPPEDGAVPSTADVLRQQVDGLKEDLATTTSVSARTNIRKEIRLASEALDRISGPPDVEHDPWRDPSVLVFVGDLLAALEAHDLAHHRGVSIDHDGSARGAVLRLAAERMDEGARVEGPQGVKAR